MILFPAVDILNGKCVRLLYGDYDKVTEYGDPVCMAQKWEREGAQWLHVVDLDAAKSGSGVNLSCVRAIVSAVKIPVQTGGGVRSLADAETRLSAGAARVILGTACCETPELVQTAVRSFGAERVVCGIDARDGFVATRGWRTQSQIKAADLGRDMFACGVRYTVYTDISRDGALTGVNTEACKEMARATRLQVIASGGVSACEDIVALKKADMYGAILGKALYTQKLTLSQAIAANA